MAYAAEIERVKTLLRHAKQLSGDSSQADERTKSLSSRLEALQQLAGENTSPIEEESASEETNVEADVAEAEVAVAEEAVAENQSAPDELDS